MTEEAIQVVPVSVEIKQVWYPGGRLNLVCMTMRSSEASKINETKQLMKMKKLQSLGQLCQVLNLNRFVDPNHPLS